MIILFFIFLGKEATAFNSSTDEIQLFNLMAPKLRLAQALNRNDKRVCMFQQISSLLNDDHVTQHLTLIMNKKL